MTTHIEHNINSIIADLSALPTVIKEKIKRHLTTVLVSLQADLMAASPVGRSGHFKGSWDMETPNIFNDTIEGSVYNNLIYAEPLEIGSPKGGRPWGQAGERTVESGGRIWSSQAEGGVMAGVVNDAYENSIMQSIADNILAEI